MVRRQARTSRFVAVAALVGFIAACSSFQGYGLTIEAPSGGTLHVAFLEPTWQGLDPQAAYTFGQLELLRCCLLRTLMTYPGLRGNDGAKVVPDLAVAPPSVSADRLVWTFHLRRGVHYAPPMSDVEVTVDDIVRAVLRSGSPDAGFNPGGYYLPLIQGFAAYANGTADSVAGLSTPDRFTLRVALTRPDSSIVHLFALPFTAPIPPLPGEPEAALGAATGHPLGYNDQTPGYGPFLVATGPYMFDGAPNLDFSLPPERQAPVSGFRPAWLPEDRGQITLVRNPSWKRASDPNRPGTADRIEIEIGPAGPGLVEDLQSGRVDVTIGGVAANVLRRLRSSPVLGDRVVETSGLGSSFLTVNLAQPPFDDEHVRRALALMLDHRALARAAQGPGAIPTSHLVPDPMEGSFLSSWDPFVSPKDGGDIAAARAEMDASRYGKGGLCSSRVCSNVVVAVTTGNLERTAKILRAELASLGIRAEMRPGYEACKGPESHIALCQTSWLADYQSPGNFFVIFVSSRLGAEPGLPLLGASTEELRSWGYSSATVPSIDPDYMRCAGELGVMATLCWARLDQLVVGRLAAILPIGEAPVVRLKGIRVASYSLDQAFGEPSLDRIALIPDRS